MSCHNECPTPCIVVNVVDIFDECNKFVVFVVGGIRHRGGKARIAIAKYHCLDDRASTRFDDNGNDEKEEEEGSTVTITSDDVIIANGVSGALELALSSLLDENATLLGEFSDNDEKYGEGRGFIMCAWEGGRTVAKLAIDVKSSVRLHQNMFANSPLVLFSHPQERNVRIANDEAVIATRRDAPVVTMTLTATKI